MALERKQATSEHPRQPQKGWCGRWSVEEPHELSLPPSLPSTAPQSGVLDTTAPLLCRASPPSGAVGSMGRGCRNGWPGQHRRAPSWERLSVEVGSPGRRVGPRVCAGDPWKEKPLGTSAAWGRLPGLGGSRSCLRSSRTRALSPAQRGGLFLRSGTQNGSLRSPGVPGTVEASACAVYTC